MITGSFALRNVEFCRKCRFNEPNGAKLFASKSSKLKVKDIKNRHKVDSKNDRLCISDARFVLGNGVEAVTPSNLLNLVKTTAPYFFPQLMDKSNYVLDVYDEEDVIDLAESSLPDKLRKTSEDDGKSKKSLSQLVLTGSSHGWNDVLLVNSEALPPCTEKPSSDQRLDYFVLCLASHFSTVASFVPTDVDSKIRDHCWRDPDVDVIRAQYDVLKHAWAVWDVRDVSAKALVLPSSRDSGSLDILSGHGGEWMSVFCGAIGAFHTIGDVLRAKEAEEILHNELCREAALFTTLVKQVQEDSNNNATELLMAAAILTHNVGDVDQGLSYWDIGGSDESCAATRTALRVKYGKLAHEDYDRFGGVFGVAKCLYKELLSAEGHRNYPLREVKELRRHIDLMLPLGPWLEDWGAKVAMSKDMSDEDKTLVVRQLLRGCDTTSKAYCVPNQVGYYRALQGFNAVSPLDRLVQQKALDKDCREVLKTHDVRMHLCCSKAQFASKLARRAREILLKSPVTSH